MCFMPITSLDAHLHVLATSCPCRQMMFLLVAHGVHETTLKDMQQAMLNKVQYKCVKACFACSMPCSLIH